MAEMTRRQALKVIYKAIAAVGASSFLSFEDLVEASTTPAKKVNVLWIHGSSCSGCSCGFLDIEYVSVVDILTQFTNVLFHPDVSLATGDQVTRIFEDINSNTLPYVLVLEGGIPVGLPHACMMADKPMTYWVQHLASKAVACIAAGTCAAFGGITKMHGSITGSMDLSEFLRHKGIKKPVVNIPNCPIKPEHLVYTVLHYASTGTLPQLDSFLRPTRFFSKTNHERCIYYSDFQEERFSQFIGDPGCLFKLGCQGVITMNDCLINGHNSNTNTCIRAGHPCIGCASEHFPRQIMLHSFKDDRPIVKDFQSLPKAK